MQELIKTHGEVVTIYEIKTPPFQVEDGWIAVLAEVSAFRKTTVPTGSLPARVPVGTATGSTIHVRRATLQALRAVLDGVAPL